MLSPNFYSLTIRSCSFFRKSIQSSKTIKTVFLKIAPFFHLIQHRKAIQNQAQISVKKPGPDFLIYLIFNLHY